MIPPVGVDSTSLVFRRSADDPGRQSDYDPMSDSWISLRPRRVLTLPSRSQDVRTASFIVRQPETGRILRGLTGQVGGIVPWLVADVFGARSYARINHGAPARCAASSSTARASRSGWLCMITSGRYSLSGSAKASRNERTSAAREDACNRHSVTNTVPNWRSWGMVVARSVFPIQRGRAGGWRDLRSSVSIGIGRNSKDGPVCRRNHSPTRPIDILVESNV